MTSIPDETARAWADIDLAALVANARTVARISGARLLPMVKANGYGLGAVAVRARAGSARSLGLRCGDPGRRCGAPSRRDHPTRSWSLPPSRPLRSPITSRMTFVQ